MTVTITDLLEAIEQARAAKENLEQVKADLDRSLYEMGDRWVSKFQLRTELKRGYEVISTYEETMQEGVHYRIIPSGRRQYHVAQCRALIGATPGRSR